MKVKSPLVMKNVVYTLLISTFILAITSKSAYSATPSLACQPLIETVNIGESLVVNVTVIDIIDLTTWQVRINFNKTLLNCTNAWYPIDHVFAGKNSVPVEPIIDNTLGYVQHGCTLVFGQTGFSGIGTLFQIEFEGLSVGKADLNYSKPYGEDTFLWDSNDELISVTIVESSVDVIPEFSSLMLVSSLMVLTLVAVALARKSIRKPKVYQPKTNN